MFDEHEYLILDLEKMQILGKTTKSGFRKQIERLRELKEEYESDGGSYV